MQQPVSPGGATLSAPRFYLTGRQPLRPGAIVMATLGAAGALGLVLYALGQTGHAHFEPDKSGPGRSSTASSSAKPEDQDDPNQVDTIVLGDPADAPVPARKGDHVSPVHPTILVHLPRFGDEVGLIPDNAPGRLLYGWLAAFNQASESGLEKMLPNTEAPVIAAQLALREQTGGFNLLSAKEVQPGVLVFRLRDQTPAATEVLGTLQMRANSNPPAIASFSLRAVGTGAAAAAAR